VALFTARSVKFGIFQSHFAVNIGIDILACSWHLMNNFVANTVAQQFAISDVQHEVATPLHTCFCAISNFHKVLWNVWTPNLLDFCLIAPCRA